MIPSFAETYLSNLETCGFITPQLSKISGRPADEIVPGTFLLVGEMVPVIDEDAPYSWMAFDKRHGNLLDDFVWLDPMHLPRTGSSRLDRVCDLARYVRSAIQWISEHKGDPRTGRLADTKAAPLGASCIEYPNGEAWCVRIPEAGHSNDSTYPHPLSVFGHLYCLGPLLREKARALLTTARPDFRLDALSAVAAEPGHPILWPEARLADLDRIPAELLRYASKWPAQADVGDPPEPPSAAVISEDRVAVNRLLSEAADSVEAFARQLPAQFDLRGETYRSRTDKPTRAPHAYADAQAVIENLGKAVMSIEGALRAMEVRSLEGEPLPPERAHVWVQWQGCQAPQQWKRLADELISLGRSILHQRTEYITSVETIDNSFTVLVVPASAVEWASHTSKAIRKHEDVFGNAESDSQAAIAKPATRKREKALANAEVDSLVGDWIAQHRAKGKPIEEMTRDGIVEATGVAAGRVSASNPWKALAEEKRRAKLKERPAAEAADPADLAADNLDSGEGEPDWDEVERQQEKDQRRPTRDR